MAGNGFNVANIKQVANYSGTTPGFINESVGNYHLATNSILVGNGTNLSYLFNTDFDGLIRGTYWDKGAYVFANTTTNIQDTNTYDTNIVVTVAHVWQEQATFALTSTKWVTTGRSITNVDGLGVQGSPQMFLRWYNSTNIPIATNTVVSTNALYQLDSAINKLALMIGTKQ
jgi:hypothetical protein